MSITEKIGLEDIPQIYDAGVSFNKPAYPVFGIECRDDGKATKVIAAPGGYFMVPEGEECIGDISNVLFTNGWIADEDGKVFIYYASSDTRMHVATSTIDKLVDYCMNTPQDGLSTSASVETLKELIEKNLKILNK